MQRRAPIAIIAINAWSLPAELGPLEQCAEAAAAGFVGIELAVGSDGPLRFDSTPAIWRELADRAAAFGIEITSLTTASVFQAHFASPEASLRQTAIDRARHMLDAAASMGVEAIVLIPAIVGRAADARPQSTYSDAFRYSYDALSQLRFDAEAVGVTIAIENAWNRFLLSPLEMADLIDRVNSPRVGVCFDTGNVMATGYPEDWIRTLSHRIVRIHIKDYDLNRPGRSGFVALGEGSVNWHEVRKALQEVHYEGPLIFEGPGESVELRVRMARVLEAG